MCIRDSYYLVQALFAYFAKHCCTVTLFILKRPRNVHDFTRRVVVFPINFSGISTTSARNLNHVVCIFHSVCVTVGATFLILLICAIFFYLDGFFVVIQRKSFVVVEVFLILTIVFHLAVLCCVVVLRCCVAVLRCGVVLLFCVLVLQCGLVFSFFMNLFHFNFLENLKLNADIKCVF